MATNPIEALSEHVKSAASTRKSMELQQLDLWKNTGKEEHLQPLLKAYEPVIANKMRMWRAPSIPEAAMHAELKGHLIDALGSYDPNHAKGAALNTYVEGRMRKAIRYVMKNQNFAHIPEAQIAQISPIAKAQNELQETFGRPATHEEISQHTGISVAKVKRVLQSQISDISASKFESDPNAAALVRDEEVMALLPYSLDPKEKEVFSYLYGDKKHQKPASMGALATKLNMSSSQLSRVHSAILTKAKQYR